MNPVKDAVAGFKEIGKAYGDWYSESTDKSITPPAPQTPDKEHAIRTAADRGDVGTIKSVVGEHPVETHFQPTGVRHQLGRGVPKGN